jgi:type II secretory pathway component GspD/PulD (secretin)
MRHFLPLLVSLGLGISGRAQDLSSRPIQANFPNADVRDVLSVYQMLTKTPVFVAVDVRALVNLKTENPIGPADMIELIRRTLLEEHGIELRTAPSGEIFAAWSKDPKYARQKEGATSQEGSGGGGRKRLRIINNK